MISRRWLYPLALVLVVGCFGPVSRFWNYLNGEAFYRGRPASYWSRELRGWMEIRWELTWRSLDPPIVIKGSTAMDRGISWCRSGHPWEAWVRSHARWITKYLPEDPKILDGDMAAFDVLLVLLDDESPQVRCMATQGLGKLRGTAMGVIPALRQRLMDVDTDVREEAERVLHEIDKASAVP